MIQIRLSARLCRHPTEGTIVWGPLDGYARFQGGALWIPEEDSSSQLLHRTLLLFGFRRHDTGQTSCCISTEVRTTNIPSFWIFWLRSREVYASMHRCSFDRALQSLRSVRKGSIGLDIPVQIDVRPCFPAHNGAWYIHRKPTR